MVRMVESSSQASGTPAEGLPVLLTVDEVAAWLKMGPATVRSMAAAGKIPVSKVGREWRFERDVLVAWLRQERP